MPAPTIDEVAMTLIALEQSTAPDGKRTADALMRELRRALSTRRHSPAAVTWEHTELLDRAIGVTPPRMTACTVVLSSLLSCLRNARF